MKAIFFTIILLTAIYPFTAFSSSITETTNRRMISLQYANIFLPYKSGILREEGVLVSGFNLTEKVSISAGFFSRSIRKGTSEKQSLSFGASGDILGSALGDFSFDANLDSGGISFSQSMYKQYYDFIVFLSRSVLSKQGHFGNKNVFYNSYETNIYIHGGFRYGIRTDTTNYTININDKKLDEVNNPLGRSKNTGILFLLGAGIDARFSHIIGRIDLLLTYPLRESFAILSIGGAI